MEYRYGNRDNYEDFASGRVLYNCKGITNFPARLAEEIFGRCLEFSDKKRDICLYDCCCGGGYLLTVLGFLYGNTITRIIGSDINRTAVDAARSNLDLLQSEGIKKRLSQIRELKEQYGKVSHEEAEESAIRLLELREDNNIVTEVFAANALNGLTLTAIPDIIMTDVPYGDLVSWEGADVGSVNLLLDKLYDLCGSNTIIGICMDKAQKNTNKSFRRLEKQQIGKRKFEILIKE